MRYAPIRTLRGRTVVLTHANVDTDLIVPGRYLKGTARVGLGSHLFAGWRYDEKGRPRPEFPLNRPAAQGATVLVAGANFGCGSSREHAVWALLDFGFRAVVAPSFGDIFRQNALKNRLPAVAVGEDAHAVLLAAEGEEVTVDVERCSLRLPGGGTAWFPLDAFARHCLLEGVDELGFLLGQEPAIARFEETRR